MSQVKAPAVPELRKTKVGGQSRDWQLVSVATGGFIAQVSSEAHADAIVRAANAHAELLTTLSELVEAIGDWDETLPLKDPRAMRFNDALTKAMEVVASHS